MVKDYGRLLGGDPDYAARARRVSGATRDLAELIEPGDLVRAGLFRSGGPRITWQAPCTLQHGQRIGGRVESLLEAAGCNVVPTREGTLCCGSAGTYSLLQPELSAELRRRKMSALMDGSPQAIVTANIGCLEHLRTVSPVPVRHWIELVADTIHQ
jgi:glycolate oxidase iron-sulfur subunit